MDTCEDTESEWTAFLLVECARKLYHHNHQQLRTSAEEVVRKEPEPPTVLLSSQKRHSVDVSRPQSPAEDLPVVTSEHAM